jgi:hypothetical protein
LALDVVSSQLHTKAAVALAPINQVAKWAQISSLCWETNHDSLFVSSQCIHYTQDATSAPNVSFSTSQNSEQSLFIAHMLKLHTNTFHVIHQDHI